MKPPNKIDLDIVTLYYHIKVQSAIRSDQSWIYKSLSAATAANTNINLKIIPHCHCYLGADPKSCSPSKTKSTRGELLVSLY